MGYGGNSREDFLNCIDIVVIFSVNKHTDSFEVATNCQLNGTAVIELQPKTLPYK